MSSNGSSSSGSGSESEPEAGPSHFKQYTGESELEESEQESSDEETSEDELEALKANLPLKALAKAHKLLQPKTAKRPRLAEAEELAEPKQRRSGRTEPRNGPLKMDTERAARMEVHQERQRQIEHRANKHAPMEMSSKRAVGRARTVVEVPKSQARDPRFDPTSGTFSKEAFDRSYGFLHDQRKEELAQLRRAVFKARKNASLSNQAKVDLEMQLSKLQSQVSAEEKTRREADAIKKWHSAEKDKQAADGKRPFFLKRGQKKELLKESKAEELKGNKKRARKHQAKQESKQAKRDRMSKPPERQSAV